MPYLPAKYSFRGNPRAHLRQNAPVSTKWAERKLKSFAKHKI
jgi:hypothetical protein